MEGGAPRRLTNIWISHAPGLTELAPPSKQNSRRAVSRGG
jgi:hypothetical protein